MTDMQSKPCGKVGTLCTSFLRSHNVCVVVADAVDSNDMIETYRMYYISGISGYEFMSKVSTAEQLKQLIVTTGIPHHCYMLSGHIAEMFV